MKLTFPASPQNRTARRGLVIAEKVNSLPQCPVVSRFPLWRGRHTERCAPTP